MPISTTKATPEPQKTVEREIPEEKEKEIQLRSSVIESLPESTPKSYLDELCFLEEEVEIYLEPSTDPNNTGRLVTVSVNGIDEYFMRGEWKKTKRKYADALLNGKRQNWIFGYKTGPDGSAVQTESSTQHLEHPFQMRDQNPKGPAWLQRRLMERV